MYQVLAYIEEANVWSEYDEDSVSGSAPPAVNCPSRRDATLRYRWLISGENLNDYSGNGGDTNEGASSNIGLTPAPTRLPPGVPRPRFQTGTIIWWQAEHIKSTTSPLKNPLVSLSKIEDGTSKTMLIGEKGIPSNLYGGGTWGDNYGWQMGHAWESVRFSNKVPRQDAEIAVQGDGVNGWPCGGCDYFGSAHAGGFNASMVDGSVHSISYDVDHDVFRAVTNRRDQTSFDFGDL
jgi:prepilin-type processing-associated H-X9-DG protein